MRSGLHSLGYSKYVLSTALLLGICGGGEDDGRARRAAEDPEPAPAASGERLKGYLGISTAPVPEAVRAQITLEEGFGVSVVFVAPGGPVDRAGIRRYDILVAFDDQQLTTSAGLAALSASREPGDEVALTALRKGKARAFPTVLGDCRDAPPAAAAMFAPDLSFGDLVSEILDRNSKTLQVELSPDGALQLRLGDHFNAVEDLFNLLKRQPAGKGLLWETRPLKREQVHVETAEAEVTIFRDSDGGTRVVATDKLTGAELYSGTVDPPPGKDMPPEVRAIVERALPMLEKPGEFRGTERAPQAPQAPGARQ